MQGAARRALGAQYTGFWFDTFRQGLSVAFAPGPLDATAARTAILAELAADFTPEQIAYVAPSLNVLQDTYSEADLDAVRQQIGPLTQSKGWNVGYGISCFETGSWRVSATRYGVESTPEVIAETEALFAPFGDRVHVSYCTCVITAAVGSAPAPGLPTTQPPAEQPPLAEPAAVRVADYVSRPKTGRCVRGTLSVRAKNGAKSVRLTAGRRHVTAKAGRKAQLKLKQRSTRVTVTVTLEDGRSASQRVSYKRCA